ncbi:hypothetical protein ACJX0J_007282, partial [Zea mays]
MYRPNQGHDYNFTKEKEEIAKRIANLKAQIEATCLSLLGPSPMRQNALWIKGEVEAFDEVLLKNLDNTGKFKDALAKLEVYSITLLKEAVGLGRLYLYGQTNPLFHLHISGWTAELKCYLEIWLMQNVYQMRWKSILINAHFYTRSV